MDIWCICTKVIDGKEEIIASGKNIVITDNYHRTMVTDELFARQTEKLEIIDGELHVKDGAQLLTLQQLNQNNEDIPAFPENDLNIVTPVNLGGD